MQLSIWTLAVLFGVFQGAFLSAVFLFKRGGDQPARLLLVGLLLILTAILSEFLLVVSGQFYSYPHLIFVTAPLWWIPGPLLYFYVRRLVGGKRLKMGIVALHLIPFSAALITMSVQFYGLPAQAKIDYLTSGTTVSQETFMSASTLIHLFIYTIWCEYTIRQGAKRFKKQASSTGILHARWVRIALLFIIAYVMLALSAALLPNPVSQWITHIDYIIIWSLLVHGIAYLAIAQPGSLYPLLKAEAPPINGGKPKYQSSTLSIRDAEEGKQRLVAYMESNTPYLNNELTLPALSDAMGMSPHHVSQIINQEFDINFFEFVNRYRVEEAKKRMLDTRFDHFTILAIGLDAGFNSKSSFNRVFKNHTGMTPSQWRRHQASTRLSLTEK